MLAKGLRVPWGIAFLPDGGALVTERDTRRILQVGPESDADGLTVTAGADDRPRPSRAARAACSASRSPRSTRTDKTIFVYYTTDEDNRIARLHPRRASRTPISPASRVAGIHNGGRLAFGPDGFLYATTGDAGARGHVQDLESLGGKILRMTPDGKPAPGNPFRTRWSGRYGHRNVQGIAWDAGERHVRHRVRPEHLGRDQPDRAGQELRLAGGRGRRPATSIRRPARGRGRPTRRPARGWHRRARRSSPRACGARLWLVRADRQRHGARRPAAAAVGEYGRLRAAVAAPDGSLWVSTSNQDGRGTRRPDDDRILRLVLESSGGAGKS